MSRLCAQNKDTILDSIAKTIQSAYVIPYKNKKTLVGTPHNLILLQPSGNSWSLAIGGYKSPCLFSSRYHKGYNPTCDGYVSSQSASHG